MNTQSNVIPMFSFNNQKPRGEKIEMEPRFVATDACRILPLRANQPSGPITHHHDKRAVDERTNLNLMETIKSAMQAVQKRIAELEAELEAEETA